MNNLVVDIGNTSVKVAVLNDNDELVALGHFDHFGSEAMAAVVEMVAAQSICRAIVSSTRGEVEAVVAQLCRAVERVVLFDHNTALPIGNCYATPETLGRDRLAAAVGAVALYDADNYLVVDLGSALTIDLVTREGGFEGGVISPGLMMRFRALHDFTAKLPLCSPSDEQIEVARSTKEAIEQGVMEGVAFEIEGHIAKLERRKGKNVIIFTGGDAKKLVNRIKNTIFANREVVLVGLNRILNYNEKRNRDSNVDCGDGTCVVGCGGAEHKK